ncbi:MAG: hypothetical protein KF684_08790 [Phycisphaeraceae bacterium]|nr:hypothetical protein [Phycisphaeraceae bacterium]
MPTDDEKGIERSQWYAEGWVIAALLCIAAGFGAIFFTMLGKPPMSERALTGEWLGGLFGAFAGLASAFLLFGALRLQMTELALQRKELQLTREEMRAAREVHDAAKQELAEQTRIAKRAALLDHIFAAARAMRDVNPQPYRAKPLIRKGERARVYEEPEPEFIAAQMHLGMLLRDQLLDSEERSTMIEQFGLNIAYQRSPGNITPSMAETLEIQ